MKVVAGRVPSRCPAALPQISPAELERADRIIRQSVAIPDGMTTHWVGEEDGGENLCQCHPDAPYATPEQVERHLTRAGASGRAAKAATGRKAGDLFARLSAAEKSALEAIMLPGSKGKFAETIIAAHKLRGVVAEDIIRLRKLLSNNSAKPNLAHEQT